MTKDRPYTDREVAVVRDILTRLGGSATVEEIVRLSAEYKLFLAAGASRLPKALSR
jgi:hypothetical protein